MTPSGQHHRIAFLTGSLAGGGSTTLTLLLAKALRDEGCECKIISLDRNNPEPEALAASGADFFLLDHPNLIFEDRLRVALQVLADFKPTTAVSCLSASSFELLRYIPPGVKRVGLILADDEHVYSMVEHYTEFLDLILGNAEAIDKKLKTRPSFSNSSTGWFVTGVPVPAPPADTPNSGPIRIIFMARLVREQKRVHLLPEILGHLAKSGRPFEWTIVGDGPDREWLESNMRSTTPGQSVRFLGAVDFSKVDETLRGQDVFLLTSDYEGQPLTLIHAMMNGVVPVASDLESGIPEVVSPETGLLADPSDSWAYAQAILELDADRPRRAELSRNARAFVMGRYSVEAMAKQWLDRLGPADGLPVEWPASQPIKAPLFGRMAWYYLPPVVFLRRLLLKFKAPVSMP